MKLVNFYHVWVDGAWEAPLEDHLRATERVPFAERYVAFVGRDVAEVMHRYPAAHPLGRVYRGFEEVTLNRVREYAGREDALVFYCHSKGAHDRSELNARWRQRMYDHCCRRWAEVMEALVLDGFDAAGPHWLTPGRWPHADITPPGFFGGNFWWARTDYLRKLPELRRLYDRASGMTEDRLRWQAERWVGRADPRVYNLLDCWPDQGLGSQW